jgi:tetratricopeptide (TPR) repeat protein
MTRLRYALLCICLTLSLFHNEALGQLGRFQKARKWTDATGKFNETANLISSNGDVAVIELADGRKKTVAVDRLSTEDQKFVEKFVKSAFSDLKTRAKECVFAADALQLYRDFQESGLVSSDHRLEIESRIEVLLAQSEVDAIILDNKFLPKNQLLDFKSQTHQRIRDWINFANQRFALQKDVREDQKLLRLAIKDDPTSIDGLILLSLLLEVRDANYSAAQRHLEDAIRAGKRYLSISSENDKANLQIAMNNLGVSYARSNRLPKAYKTWTQSLELTTTFSSLIKHNLARASLMVSNKKSGLSTNNSTKRDLQSYQSLGGADGWKLMSPVAFDGKHWTDIRFVLASKFSTINGRTIEDRRCVKCNGTSLIRCLNKLCQNGSIRKDIYGRKVIQTPRGPRDGGYGLLCVEHHKCPTCNGDGQHRCPCCNGGRQN